MVVNPISLSRPGTEGKCLSKKVVVMGCAGTSWVQRTFGVSIRLVYFTPISLYFLQFSEHDTLLPNSGPLNIAFPLVITLLPIPIPDWALSLTNSDSSFKSQFVYHLLREPFLCLQAKMIPLFTFSACLLHHTCTVWLSSVFPTACWALWKHCYTLITATRAE